MSLNTYFPHFPCFNCNTPLEISSNLFVRYLYSNERNCPHCQASEYLWNSALRSLKENFFLNHHASILLGANLKSFKIDMAQNQLYELDLTRYEIPPYAHVLNINFTPEGDALFPVFLFHTNELTPLHKIPTVLPLYGRPLKFDSLVKSLPEYTKINISVIYSTHPENEAILDRLYSAFQAFLRNDYGLMGHDAHSAIEDILKNLIKKFEENLSISSLSLGYEKNLSIRIKELCNYYQISLLEEKYRKLLVQLYKEVRTKRTHETSPIHISLEKAADLLCAAIFTYHYLVELQRRVVLKKET